MIVKAFGATQFWEQHRLLLDQCPLAAFTTDTKGRFLLTNKAWFKLTGINEEDSLGKGWQKAVHPEDLDTLKSKWHDLTQKQEAFSHRFRFFSADGKITWVSTQASPIYDEEGTWVGYLGFHTNITQHMDKIESNRKLEKIVKEAGRIAQVGGWEIDPESGRPNWSEEIYKIHELDPKQATELDQAINYYAPEARPIIRDHYQKLVEEGREFDLELPLITAKNNPIWVRAVGKREILANGKPRIFGIVKDITRSKLAQLHSKSYEKLFRLSTQPVAIANFDGYFTDLNPSWETMLGWSEAELKSKPFLEFVHPEDLEKTIQESQALQNRRTQSLGFTNRYLCKDGSSRALAWYVTTDWETQKYFCIVQDITEKTRQEAELKRLHKEATNYKYAMDQAGIVSVADRAGRISYVNDMFCEISGYPREVLLGSDHRIINSGYHPPGFFKNLWATIGRGDVWRGEIRNRAKNGSLYWVDTTIVPLRNEVGEVDSYLSLRNIITRKKQIEADLLLKEERLEQAQHIAKMGSWEFNPITTQVIWSNELYRIWELDPESIENLYQAYLSRVHPEDLETLTSIISNALKSGEGYKVEHRLLFPDGRIKFITGIGESLKDKEGKVIGLRGVAIDSTEIKNMQAQLVQAKEVAESAAKAKSEFLSMMSHEIRTPMNGVLGITNLLMEDDPSSHQLEYLQTLQFSAKNLLGIINDILDFSKIEAGRVQLEATTFNLKDLLSIVKKVNQPKADERINRIRLLYDDELPNLFIGDPVRINQIMTNLVGNAVKFTEYGIVTISAGMLSRGQEDCTLEIAVKDTGIGIPEEDQNHIFERFSQAGSDTTRRFGGTGLGLTITKRLLELMGSTIQVKSKPGEGATFSFQITLPTAKKARPDRNSGLPKSLRKSLDLNVLLVDDNPVNIMVAGKLLSNWGVRTRFVENGRQAVEAAKTGDFDLILMDLQMPVMDGYDASKTIREFDDHTPIIALTADAMPEVEEKIRRHGIDSLIIKPFDPLDLYQKLKSAQRIHKRREDNDL